MTFERLTRLGGWVLLCGCVAEPVPSTSNAGDKGIQLNCEAWGPKYNPLDCTEDCENLNRAWVDFEKCTSSAWTFQSTCDAALDLAAERLERCTTDDFGGARAWPPATDAGASEADAALGFIDDLLTCGSFRGQYDCTEQCQDRNSAWRVFHDCKQDFATDECPATDTTCFPNGCAAKKIVFLGSGAGTGAAQLLEACIRGY